MAIGPTGRYGWSLCWSGDLVSGLLPREDGAFSNGSPAVVSGDAGFADDAVAGDEE